MADARARPATGTGTGTGARVGLEWLVNVRWGAALTQVLASVSFGLANTIPLVPALACVGPLVVTNAWLATTRRRAEPSDRAIFGLLLLDVVALSAWLMLAGGPANPWSALYLVYVALSALLLVDNRPWAVVTTACFGYGSTFVFDPLGRDPHAAHQSASAGAFDSHLEGMYVAFVVSSVLVAYFITRMADSLRERDRALQLARERTEHATRAAALTTLAAGAAHELGSPLATIAIAAKELERALAGDAALEALAEDARLVRDEVTRCGAILDRMASRAGMVLGGAPERVELAALGAALGRSIGADRFARVSVQTDAGSVNLPARALEPMLENLIHNALDASPDGPVRVKLELVATPEPSLRIEVADEGHGMDAATSARALEPFFTTKPAGFGMGLGLFLVDTLARELGGSTHIDSAPGRGTTITVTVPSGMELPS